MVRGPKPKRGKKTRGVVMAHSISSNVELDYDHGTAHKTYAPPLWVKLLYRAAFQSPFPYSDNGHAVEAARHRREIAGLLTQYWYGTDFVSPVVDVHDRHEGEPHGIAFVTELVEGSAPKDNKHARRFLRAITRNFLDAGLPTWQVTPYNPRAVGNLIEEADGTYRVIDLESNLVAPLFPLSGLVGAIRQGNFPVFDDIDTVKLRGYVAHHEVNIIDRLGQDAFNTLTASIDAYDDSVGRWRQRETRIISKTLQFALKLVDVPTWARAIRRSTKDSATMADRLVEQGIGDWTSEGHLNTVQADELRAAAKTPEVKSSLTHLGAHIAMTIPLRFPLGSLARAAWTVSLRAKAEWNTIVRRKPIGAARQEHTLAVALVSLIPTFGAAAYMMAKPLRSNRALAVIALDRMMRKTPAQLYRRLHMSSLMVWQSGLDTETAPRESRGVWASIVDRAGTLRPASITIAAVLAAYAAIAIAGAVLYVDSGAGAVFEERGLLNTFDAMALAAAGAAGVAAFFIFWERRSPSASVRESGGIFFWGISGVGLLYFAIDQHLALHERMGAWLQQYAFFTEGADDMILMSMGITALSIVWLFRQEIGARQASSTLLVGGIVASTIMILCDVFASGWMRPVEVPAQAAGVGLFVAAYAQRLVEVRAGALARVPALEQERTGSVMRSV